MKPIAKFGDLPFNSGGIRVFAASDNDNNPISDELFLFGERSTLNFDVINEDTTKVYRTMQMVHRDKNFKEFPLDATKEEIQQGLGKNQFVVKVYDLVHGDILGYAYKFFPNEIILSNGKHVPVVNYNTQTSPFVHIEKFSIPYTSIIGLVGTSYQLYSNIEPENATNKTVKWESSNPEFATITESGYISYHSPGYTYISARTVDGNFFAESRFAVIYQTNNEEK